MEGKCTERDVSILLLLRLNERIQNTSTDNLTFSYLIDTIDFELQTKNTIYEQKFATLDFGLAR